MKEATGELNMTVITVVAIAAIAALFTVFIYPSIKANIALTSACSNIDARGNYNYTTTDNSGALVTCESFNCTAIVSGTNYTKTCTQADGA